MNKITIRPLPTRPLTAEELLPRWRGLPRMDAAKLERDIDGVLDPSL